MKYRVDFALIEDGKILAELSAVAETLEGAIYGATITTAPHVADGRTLAILRAGYLCQCGVYHPVGVAAEMANAQHGQLAQGAEASAN